MSVATIRPMMVALYYLCRRADGEWSRKGLNRYSRLKRALLIGASPGRLLLDLACDLQRSSPVAPQ
ncbi:hypothetical protein [Pseudomonas bohemica]|uniref:hypothetical protein n=1 Tax=Pseudomonas bohemica TaxID=2044872 RepID=UPI0018FE0397|nr:hypothetical protein [Pseudomonas bohemica]